MIKKFKDLEIGDRFFFIDNSQKPHYFQVIGRTRSDSIRALQATPYLLGRSWQVDSNPDKLIPVYARAK